MFSFLARESCIAFSGWPGGWHGRERCGFQGFQEAGLRLRTDNSGKRSCRAQLVAAPRPIWTAFLTGLLREIVGTKTGPTGRTRDRKRINHEEAYSMDDPCTNRAEEFFPRLRSAEIGIHHHVAGAY